MIPVILIEIYLVLHVAGRRRRALPVLGGTGLGDIGLGRASRDGAESSLASILLSVRNPDRTVNWI